MITIKVTLSNGNNWTTRFNGSFKDAEGYYIGTYFETSDELHDHECVRVELAWVFLQSTLYWSYEN